VIKTKEMIVNYGERRTEHTCINIDRAVVEQVERSPTNYHGPNTLRQLEEVMTKPT
jgi:hypothetical protein